MNVLRLLRFCNLLVHLERLGSVVSVKPGLFYRNTSFTALNVDANHSAGVVFEESSAFGPHRVTALPARSAIRQISSR